MKIAKKLKLQVRVGLAVGFGLMALAAPVAYAGPPCTPDSCSYDGLAECYNRSVPPPHNQNPNIVSSPVLMPTGSQLENGGCRDCHGDCRKNPIAFRVKYYRCDLFDLELGEVVVAGAFPAAYTKTVETEGPESECP